MLKNGADINYLDSTNQSALNHVMYTMNHGTGSKSAHKNLLDLAEFLLINGADPTLALKNNSSLMENPMVMAVLLKYGLKVNDKKLLRNYSRF